MNSCIYEGHVDHRRFLPCEHAFRFRLFMLYLDLAELPALFDEHLFWSARRPALAWFRRADYMGPADVPLDTTVRSRVAAELGRRPEGPIRVLTQVRTFGYVFNPVSFYYVFDGTGARVESIVAEITNTPWNERHAYVLTRDPDQDSTSEHRFQKEFHVSPFMSMEQEYVWSLGTPGSSLSVHMENHRSGERMFDVHLSMQRRALSSSALNGSLARYPLLTLGILFRIHLEAFRLWRKKVPFHSHPAKKRAQEVGP